MNEMTASTQATAMLFLHAQTGLHPGSGTALGTVDLPVQRERHTQWPLIPGSALKGILRDKCREAAKVHHGGDRKRANEEDPDLTTVFGPGKVDESSAHAGALSVTDARILAFPVRSLKGVFAWVTCPAVLGRLNRDLSLVGSGNLEVPAVKSQNLALCVAGSPLLLMPDKKLVLEEFEFSCSENLSADLVAWIAAQAIPAADAFTSARIKTHLVVLHDDDFTHFVRHATEVVARIALDYEKKTVKSGALFYQEFLPAETLFYSLVFANASRNGQMKSAADVLGYLRGHVPESTVLQIGGDETTGKGLCTTRVTVMRE